MDDNRQYAVTGMMQPRGRSIIAYVSADRRCDTHATRQEFLQHGIFAHYAAKFILFVDPCKARQLQFASGFDVLAGARRGFVEDSPRIAAHYTVW